MDLVLKVDGCVKEQILTEIEGYEIAFEIWGIEHTIIFEDIEIFKDSIVLYGVKYPYVAAAFIAYLANDGDDADVKCFSFGKWNDGEET